MHEITCYFTYEDITLQCARKLTWYFPGVYTIMIHIKKLLDSDWLRAVQLKCNTSAKSVTPVQKVQHQWKLYIVILDYD